MTYITKIDAPLGTILAASDGDNIIGLWFEGQKYFAATLDDRTIEEEVPVYAQLRIWLDLYFAGETPDFTPPLAPKGSAFRQAIWALLMEIPRGTVTTYGALARTLRQQTGKPVSAQAVGGAVGHNPISILIPCHRVVGTGGSLTGYAGGVDKKLRLLELENVSTTGLFLPKPRAKAQV